jgi:hypothetical protein
MQIDHTSFEHVKVDPKKKKRTKADDLKAIEHWSRVTDPTEMAAAAFSQFKAIKARQRNLREEYLFNAKFLGERDNLQQGPTGPESYLEEKSFDTISDNVTLEVIETRESNVCINNPTPAFVTNGGSWKDQKKARLLNKFCLGEFHENKIREARRLVRRDDELCGFGAYKVFEEDGRMRGERVLPYELIIDELEAKYRKPTQLAHVKTILKSRLMADYGDTEAARKIIADAGLDTELTPLGGGDQGIQEYATTLEAWRLPCKKGEDGVWALLLTSGVLFKRDYKRDAFPLAFYVTDPPSAGFRGKGMVEQLRPDQIAMNLLNITEQEIIELGPPKWVIHRGARITDEELDDTILGAIEYDGPNPPRLEKGAEIPVSSTNKKEAIRASMYRKGRVSEAAVQNQKPVGLDSAPAQRTFEDITAKRMAKDFQADEQWHMDVARLFIDGAREIAQRAAEEAQQKAEKPKEGEKQKKARPSYKVRVPGPRGLEEIDWAEINMEADAYVIQGSPISSLPHTWSGRLQAVVERIGMGWMTPEQGMLAMEMPDTEAATNLSAAALACAQWVVSEMLDYGRYHQPETHFNLDLHHQMALAAYNWAITVRYPDSRLRHLRRYMSAVVALQASIKPAELAVDPAGAMQPPAALPPGGPAGMPPAPPMPIAA